MARPRAAILLPLLVLGCAADRGEEAAALMQQALLSARASIAVAGGGSPAAPSGPPATTPAPAVPVTPAATAAPRARGTAPPASAAALLGTRAAEMRHMLGDPALRRPEGSAEIWLYEAPHCRLDVILYPEGAGLVVAHAAARAHGSAGGVTEADCLSAIAGASSPGQHA